MNITPLRSNFTLKSVDIRTVLGVAPSTFADICKKSDINQFNKSKGSSKDISADDVKKLLTARGFEYGPKKVISFSICKGGVGKSTSSFYVAQRLSSYGANVLIIDADPQGNLTAAFDFESFGLEIDEETPILVDLVTKQASFEETVIAYTPNLHIIPSTPLNSTLEGKLRDYYKNPSVPIKKILEPVAHNYDYIIIDCAPALNLTNTAIVCASNLVVLPVSPDKFSYIGLKQTIEEISNIESEFGLNIDKKIVFTKFDAREHTSLKYLGDIANEYSANMFNTMIRTAADVKNAITRKENLFAFRKSNAKEDYDNFTRELMGLDQFFLKKANLHTTLVN